MRTLDLYKFIENNNLEYHKYGNEILLFVPIWIIDEFYNLIKSNKLVDDGIKTIMKDGYFCFEMIDICDYFGIDPDDVFTNYDN